MNRVFLGMSILFVAGCTTIERPLSGILPEHQPLPTEAVSQVADDVERAVQEGNRTPEIADREGLVINTPELKQVIKTRAARSEILNQFRATGFAYEDRKGLVHVTAGGKEYKKATSGRQRDRNALLVMQENSDRWALYEGIQKANKLSRPSLGSIQRAFYEARIKTMPDGQKYEDAQGNIVVKGGAAPASK